MPVSGPRVWFTIPLLVLFLPATAIARVSLYRERLTVKLPRHMVLWGRGKESNLESSALLLWCAILGLTGYWSDSLG